MRQTSVFNALNKPSVLEKEELVNFLSKHLQEYGDDPADIRQAIDYSIKEVVSFGGFTVAIKEKDQILACAVINHTGMKGYIPENILVYIATHNEHRRKGLGKAIMEEVLAHTSGDIALHVEANNPAVRLYEKTGFTNPYLEMRLKRGK
jgi:ribosomal-protein-alanine N-acetyltransferase